MGFFGPSKEEKAKQAAELKELMEAASGVVVTTGDIKAEYEIVDVIFQLGQDEGNALGQLFGGDFSGSSSEGAFEAAVQALKIKAHQIGADHVVHAGFNQRMATAANALSKGVHQVAEVFAYGTAVKVK